jgi:hypothetical protein
MFNLALEIANKISNESKLPKESKQILQLVKEILEVRWSISQEPSG